MLKHVAEAPDSGRYSLIRLNNFSLQITVLHHNKLGLEIQI